MKFQIYLILIISSFIISCSSSNTGSPFGDFKSTTCTGDNCSNSTPAAEPSIERDDNSDVILGKYDNALEVGGKCRLKDIPDSEISITVIAEGGATRTLADGFVPIIGNTAVSNRVAKCEKGRWAIAINACNNLMGAAGAHQVEFTLKGKDKNNSTVAISDGKITMNLIRSEACDASVQ